VIDDGNISKYTTDFASAIDLMDFSDESQKREGKKEKGRGKG